MEHRLVFLIRLRAAGEPKAQPLPFEPGRVSNAVEQREEIEQDSSSSVCGDLLERRAEDRRSAERAERSALIVGKSAVGRIDEIGSTASKRSGGSAYCLADASVDVGEECGPLLIRHSAHG